MYVCLVHALPMYVQHMSSQQCDCVVVNAGHSLGGALAMLAAYDICKQLRTAKHHAVEMVCYVFGAPRVGNHAFARDYDKLVPNTWSIINDQVCAVLCSVLRYAGLHFTGLGSAVPHQD